MTQCECPIAGYCARHKVKKTNGWHKLCQTRENYFLAWEQGRGIGQTIQPDESKEIRRKNIIKAIESKKKLISWVKLLRDISDAGLGDTVNRLVRQRSKSLTPDAHNALTRLLKQASCRTCDAVNNLNKQYPY